MVSPRSTSTPDPGNPIGGLTVAIHTHGRTVDEMVLRSPSGLKSALGENPKRVYGDTKKTPSTRLGTAAVIRGAFVEAQNYADRQAHAEDGKAAPARDLKSEALGLVLRREIPWRQHCHRADDIATAVRIADEFGYQLVIDHGTEAHLVADLLAAKGIPVLIGPLFTSRSKVELRNRSLANPGRLATAGVEISIITDHPVVPIHFLVHQATLAVKEGLDRETALRSITINPARVMGVDDRVGSLAVGQGRRSGALDRRPARRHAAGPHGVDRRSRGLPLRHPDTGRGRRPTLIVPDDRIQGRTTPPGWFVSWLGWQAGRYGRRGPVRCSLPWSCSRDAAVSPRELPRSGPPFHRRWPARPRSSRHQRRSRTPPRSRSRQTPSRP